MLHPQTSTQLSFVQKMWEIVNEPSHQQMIEWSQSGTSFIIKDPDMVAKELLPKYFKHSNFSSFVRQLNMYGFHKNKADLALNEFSHRNFRRDNKELLQQIKRKALEENLPELSLTRRQSNQPSHRAAKEQHNSDTLMEQAIGELSRRNEELQHLLQREIAQKSNIVAKTRKFLTSLSAQLVTMELSDSRHDPTRQGTGLNMNIINSLMTHLTNSDQMPFDFEIYERYVGCLLHLLPSSRHPIRQPPVIRPNVIILNSLQQRPTTN